MGSRVSSGGGSDSAVWWTYPRGHKGGGSLHHGLVHLIQRCHMCDEWLVLHNMTLRIQWLDVKDACDITDAVLDALMPPAAGAGVQQHVGVTGSAARVCAARATAAGTGHRDLSWQIAAW